MNNLKDLFGSKIDNTKLIGSNNFFNNQEEIKQNNRLQEKYISSVDYSIISNFARFGSAEEYYNNAISYINSNYPYDGSTSEKLSWINSLNDFEYYIYLNEFPRATGYANVSGTQYIKVYSHVNEPDITAKEAFEKNSQYTANTIINFNEGITFEAWLNFKDASQNTSILDINAITSSETGPVNIVLLNISRITGSNTIQIKNDSGAYEFNQVINDNEWHHYAFFIKNDAISISIDGQLSQEITGIDLTPSIGSYIFVPIGLVWLPLYQTTPFTESVEKSSVFEIGGGGLLSIDEARIWNSKRTPEKIGRYWFTSVDGNDLKDPSNSSLVFYFKFNEGWDQEYQFLCLDYSGRQNDGEINNYTYDCRSTGSAIDLCGFIEDKEKPDISFKGLSYSSVVKTYYSDKITKAKEYDEINSHQLYKKFPSWLLEDEESNEIKHLKQLVQVISYYFDDLYNKIGEMSEYKKPKYTTEGEKVYPFYDKILTSMGFDVTELFNNLDIIEKISSRSDITLYDQSTEKIKNTIFQNIYNNLAYILKSKGTDKSFKSLLRSYGVDDNLVRVNLYADNTSSDVFNRTKEAVVKKKTITLVNDNSIFLSSSAVQENSSLSYYTFESCLSFPAALKPTSNTTSSICGVQNNIDQNLLDWSTNNNHYYVTVETDIISGSRFVLTNKYGGFTSSDYFEDLYDNSIWNICLRKKPDVDTLIGVDYTPNYTIELYGINETGDKKQEFSCSLPHSNEDGYLRYYIGARKEDLTGTSIYNTAVKYLYCNFWSDYLNNNVIVSHNKELMNYGVDE